MKEPKSDELFGEVTASEQEEVAPPPKKKAKKVIYLLFESKMNIFSQK